ncbi:MAG TPA: YjbF family lipoprotein [Pseudidiomarina sp.]|nr:YjbF family lipoprotein [Pseudidiomarina sp.]
MLKQNLIVPLLCLCSLLAVSGCSVRVNNFMEMAETAITEPEDFVFTERALNDLRYATWYVKTESSPQIAVILNQISGGDIQPQRNWISGAREVFVTQRGRIVASSGLAGFPRYTTNTHADPLLCMTERMRHNEPLTDCPVAWSREVEFQGHATLQAQRIVVESQFTVASQPQTYIHPDGTALQVLEVTENGTYADNSVFGAQEFSNTFWLANGRTVKSQQWVSAEHGYASMAEVKPYSGDLY